MDPRKFFCFRRITWVEPLLASSSYNNSQEWVSDRSMAQNLAGYFIHFLLRLAASPSRDERILNNRVG